MRLASNEKKNDIQRSVYDDERRNENQKTNKSKNKNKLNRRDFVSSSSSSLAIFTSSLSYLASFAEKAEAAPFCGYYADIDSPVSQAAYQSTFSEGYVNNLQTFVRQVGKFKRGNKTCLPVLVLHDQRLDMKYLEAIEILAFTPDDFRREIFFYDQLNRGKSKHSLPPKCKC